MRKSKTFLETHFTADVIESAVHAFLSINKPEADSYRRDSYAVEHDDCRWNYDSISEFLADYRKFYRYAHLTIGVDSGTLEVTRWERSVIVEVVASSRGEIESVFAIFEKAAPTSRLESAPTVESAKLNPTIFIGHGQNPAWRDLKDHLQDKHGYTVEAYESGARAGHAIRDILEDMIRKSSFAVLVLTGEDEQVDGQVRARQNVVHEAGLFQGRLGFSRAIMLLEKGVTSFSNVHGIQHIEFPAGHIKETFGEVLATIKREFPA
jgi:predicted nucleotide-binding protein